MDSGTAKQAQVAQNPDGSMRIQPMDQDIDEAWTSYKDAKRDLKAKRKIYEKIRAQKRYLKTPILSEDE